MSAKELAQIAKNHNWVHETDEYYDKESKKEKQALPDPSGLDAGISFEEEVDNEEILKKLTDKEKEIQDLNEQFEKMRLEFEAYKKQFPPQGPQAPPAPPPGIYELKRAYAQVKEERADMTKKWRLYYDMWYATLPKEEQKKETERYHNEGSCESENRIGKTDWEHEYEKLINKQQKAIKVPEPEAEINFIDELEAAPVKVVESETEPDFIDELEAAPVKPPKKDKRNETMDKMQLKLSKK
jgi:hypothetical protein